MRILAADDEPSILRLLDRFLRSWGYEPILAKDGAGAWRVLKGDDAPRVVVLDWDMPGISGIEVLRMLRATSHGADTYVVLLTARQDKADLIEGLEAGADDFLSKPFEPRELQLRLAKGVSARESRARTLDGEHGGAPPSATTLDGRYRLERKIAEGGMASVWLGVHLSLGINVAIKFMKPGVDELGDYATFEREARAAAKLRSEHIVRIYDHGLAHDGRPYLVMEYLSGDSLQERIGRRGRLPLDEAVILIEQIGRALEEAHAQGIVHRDVKPENILLVEDVERPGGFTAKLVDFGLAKPDWTQHASRMLSAGTPAYMSPEHLTSTAPVNPALDLWGLAATAFVAVTGVLPFDAPTLAAIIARVCDEPAPVPSRVAPGLPRKFDAWFARACAREPAARFQTAREFASALAGVFPVEGERPASSVPARHDGESR